MRTIFLGTPDIAVPALNALHEVSEVVAVICQPDRPSGRGLKLTPPAVKVRAQQLGLEVHQPKKLRTRKRAEWMRSLEADVALVIAYGRILPQALLDAPRRGCMNLHASLLPKYRGAAPINWAIVHGESESGICLMQMDIGCDTGPVLARHAIPIGENETAGELYARLGQLAAEVVQRDLARAVAGELPPQAQDHASATHAPMLTRADGLVPWTRPARAVHDHVRGMTPWPGAHATLAGKRFKLLSTHLAQAAGELGAPGEVVRADRDGVVIACGEGSIQLLRGQLAGRTALDAGPLVAGRAIAAGMRFELPEAAAVPAPTPS